MFGVVLLLEREPRRQTNADLKMPNETRVLIHVIVETYNSFVPSPLVAQRDDCGKVDIRQTCLQY